jgi:hypothetical protein
LPEKILEVGGIIKDNQMKAKKSLIYTHLLDSKLGLSQQCLKLNFFTIGKNNLLNCF